MHAALHANWDGHIGSIRAGSFAVRIGIMLLLILIHATRCRNRCV